MLRNETINNAILHDVQLVRVGSGLEVTIGFTALNFCADHDQDVQAEVTARLRPLVEAAEQVDGQTADNLRQQLAAAVDEQRELRDKASELDGQALDAAAAGKNPGPIRAQAAQLRAKASELEEWAQQLRSRLEQAQATVNRARRGAVLVAAQQVYNEAVARRRELLGEILRFIEDKLPGLMAADEILRGGPNRLADDLLGPAPRPTPEPEPGALPELLAIGPQVALPRKRPPVVPAD